MDLSHALTWRPESLFRPNLILGRAGPKASMLRDSVHFSRLLLPGRAWPPTFCLLLSVIGPFLPSLTLVLLMKLLCMGFVIGKWVRWDRGPSRALHLPPRHFPIRKTFYSSLPSSQLPTSTHPSFIASYHRLILVFLLGCLWRQKDQAPRCPPPLHLSFLLLTRLDSSQSPLFAIGRAWLCTRFWTQQSCQGASRSDHSPLCRLHGSTWVGTWGTCYYGALGFLSCSDCQPYC